MPVTVTQARDRHGDSDPSGGRGGFSGSEGLHIQMNLEATVT